MFQTFRNNFSAYHKSAVYASLNDVSFNKTETFISKLKLHNMWILMSPCTHKALTQRVQPTAYITVQYTITNLVKTEWIANSH